VVQNSPLDPRIVMDRQVPYLQDIRRRSALGTMCDVPVGQKGVRATGTTHRSPRRRRPTWAGAGVYRWPRSFLPSGGGI